VASARAGAATVNGRARMDGCGGGEVRSWDAPRPRDCVFRAKWRGGGGAGE
jgi:hypothetical protein